MPEPTHSQILAAVERVTERVDGVRENVAELRDEYREIKRDLAAVREDQATVKAQLEHAAPAGRAWSPKIWAAAIATVLMAIAIAGGVSFEFGRDADVEALLAWKQAALAEEAQSDGQSE